MHRQNQHKNDISMEERKRIDNNKTQTQNVFYYLPRHNFESLF